MGQDTAIEWTDHTFNPWTGCTKISPACTNCYAEVWAKRTGIVGWGDGAQRRKTSDSYWCQPVKWNVEAGRAGLRKRVFCASLADVFENKPQVVAWRYELFALIRETPNLDWLLLTKRPENIRAMLLRYLRAGFEWPSNVWLGTTVENADYLDRVGDLIECREFASVLFLSCEPLLGPLSLRTNQRYQREHGGFRPLIDDIDWVIAGGESGAHARPSHPDWFRDLRDQCVAAGVSFHFKQWGEWANVGGCDDPCGRCVMALRRWDGSRWRGFELTDANWEAGNHLTGALQLHPIGKKKAGRLLDGREWNEYPTAKAMVAV